MTVPAVILGPYSDIARQIAERLALSRQGSDPFAPWAEDVIVASSGMAHSIATALLERMPTGVAALQLRSIETLARRIANDAGHYPRVASELERRLAMRTAARTVDDPLTASRGAGAMLERSYRDMRDSGITLPDFARRTRRAGKLRNAERIQLLIRVWQTYERLIEKLGAVDPADLLLRAGSLCDRPGLAPQILAGFYDMTGAQIALVEALRSSGKLTAVFIPCEPADPETYAFAEPLLRRFGAVPPSARKAGDASGTRKDWSIRQEATREAEIRRVCATIRALIDSGVAPRSIGVVARAIDPYDAHLFDRFAREHGLTSSIAATSSLAAHPIGRALVLLLRIRERNFPRAEVLEIVRSGIRLRTQINADKADFEARQSQIAGGASSLLLQRRLESPVLGDYIAAVAELEELTAKIDVRAIQEIVERFRPATSSDVDALDALQQILDVFRRAEAWKRPFDPAAFIDAVESATVSRPATGAEQREVIWLGDVMTFRGRSFDHLFAMRMQDDVLPQRRIEDPLLVDADRRLLGLREIGDGRAEEQLLFRLMYGRTTHYSLATSDGFGKPLRPSQLLKQFAIEQKPEERANILKNRLAGLGGPEAGTPGVEDSGLDSAEPRIAASAHPRIRPLQLLARAGTAGPFDGYVRSTAIMERAAAALLTASPTKLEDFGECPQKFFLKHILGVRDLEDPEMELQINPRDKGSVDHRILEEFYRRTPPQEIFDAARALPVLPPALIRRLEAAVDEAFDELDVRLPAFNPPMRAIERRSTRRNLRHFVAEDIADLAEHSLTPSMFEYRFGNSRRHNPAPPDHEEPFVMEVRGARLTVEGMIDRVDVGYGPSGAEGIGTPGSILAQPGDAVPHRRRYRIVDYKSGKAIRHKNLGAKIDRGVRLQLALYAMAIADFFGARPDQVSGAIKPLAGGVKPADYEFELADTAERLRQTLDIFVGAILRGDFPAFPNDSDRDNDFNSCKYCPVNHSCRTRYDVDESRIILSAGEPRTLLSEERG